MRLCGFCRRLAVGTPAAGDARPADGIASPPTQCNVSGQPEEHAAPAPQTMCSEDVAMVEADDLPWWSDRQVSATGGEASPPPERTSSKPAEDDAVALESVAIAVADEKCSTQSPSKSSVSFEVVMPRAVQCEGSTRPRERLELRSSISGCRLKVDLDDVRLAIKEAQQSEELLGGAKMAGCDDCDVGVERVSISAMPAAYPAMGLGPGGFFGKPSAAAPVEKTALPTRQFSRRSVHGAPEVPRDRLKLARTLMWNYDLDGAEAVVRPFLACPLHAAAYAEAMVLRVIVTGGQDNANECLARVKAAESARDKPPEDCIATGVELDLLSAEMLLARAALSLVGGAQLRALLSLGQAWVIYRRLEISVVSTVQTAAQLLIPSAEGGLLGLLPMGKLADPAQIGEDETSSLLFGLGLLYLGLSILPQGLRSLLRFAGFLSDRERGSECLRVAASLMQGPRGHLAALVLSLYHMDLEPDVQEAGRLLTSYLRVSPECVLFHWAASILAWRYSCLGDAVFLINKALWCCGDSLSWRACYLRYELGVFHFIDLNWTQAAEMLRGVYAMTRRSDDKLLLPYKGLLVAQLAAVEFQLGNTLRGQELCRECALIGDAAGGSRVCQEFGRLAMTCLTRADQHQFAFEVMYALKQFSRLPPNMLERLHSRIGPATTAVDNLSELELVELVSALMLRACILFHMGDLPRAMEIVPTLTRVCLDFRLPSWAVFLRVHGLYWCGRLHHVNEDKEMAIKCLRKAKSSKKHIFGIAHKISVVLQSLEAEPD
mmetsp:Transcript_60997/g.141026  ORF Transcript_60997/g.141026 Transcript_60997/m.141026 type:complete len:775 (-) Transcript_60997:22-2346(-)